MAKSLQSKQYMVSSLKQMRVHTQHMARVVSEDRAGLQTLAARSNKVLALWTKHYGPSTTVQSLLTKHYGPSTTDQALRTKHYGQSTTDQSLRTKHYGPSTTV